MIMEKYKLCPVCGAKNPTTAPECEICECDLSRVRITDDSMTEQPASPPTSEESARICPECGHKNPANARKCAECGEDISDILPTTAAAPRPANGGHWVLTALDGDYAYELCYDAITVGREAKMMEYLEGKSYVSRTHAEFALEGGRLFLEDKHSSNGCYVNNEKISDRRELHSGDIVGLGGNEKNGRRQEKAAYFKAELK